MFGLCRSSPMLPALLLLIGVVNIEASDLDLLDGGVQGWLSPSRVTRCPVHSKLTPVAADGGNSVSFVSTAVSGKRFSLIEKYMPAGGLQGYGGLQLNFSTSGLGAWKLRLYDGQYNLRFTYIINKPDGAHSLTLPWSSFGAENIRRCNTNSNGVSLKPASISHLAIVLPNGNSRLTFQGMHAMRDLSALALAPTVTAKSDMAEGFDGPFVAMGITGHNDFPMMSVSSPAECAAACAKTANCRSFDYGARGSVMGECWMSLADRQAAGSAYRSWELYNYYEIKGASPDVAANKVVSAPEMTLSTDDMKAVMGFFDGPFVAMGITGHNDFDLVAVNDPAECADACTKTIDCRSFDYGARGSVAGECWLSLADRKSAGNAYKSWELYNYYEIKATLNTMEDVKKEDAKKVFMPMDAAKKDEMAESNKERFSGTSASHAHGLSSKPMACMKAVVALVIFLAM